jgi:glutamine synthetase
MSTHPFKSFGIHLFDESVIKERCPEAIYKNWKTALTKESPLDRATADGIAQAMKEWAIGLGPRIIRTGFNP